MARLASAPRAATTAPQDRSDREPGLTLRLFQLEHPPEELPILVPNQTPNVDRRVDTLQLSGDDFEGVVAPHLTRALGWLQIDEPGTYLLLLASDDGARLFLDGERAIDNDGRHGTIAVISRPLELAAGAHELLIEHFDAGGARELRLEWQRPGSTGFEPVPASALRCETDPTRVTSPGPKAAIDARKPGAGLPVAGVHPGWRVESLPTGGRPEGFAPQVGAMTFLPDGRLAFGTFDPLQRDEQNLPDIESKAPDRLWALDLATSELSEIATDLLEPSGLCVVDGELYVAHRRAVTRLTDGDGDGYMETHEIVGEGWEGWNYHQFCFGLVHVDGRLYTALSTAMGPPGWEGMETNSGSNGPLRGGIVEIDLSSGDTRVIAGGTRTPNGLGVDAEGRLLYADNQGSWMPASVLAEVRPGRFFGHYNWTRFVPRLAERFPAGGHPSVFVDRPRAAPVLWLPHGEVVNSPTEPLAIPDGPFAGQLLLGELTAGGIRRAYLEEVDGVLQGALFRFTQGLESGVNRMEWGPDGALYVGGIGAGGNWNWNGTRFGLQRLVPTGVEPFELHSVSATETGFEIRFNRSVERAWLEHPAHYALESWTYAPTQTYGGPKVDVREHAVLAARAADDGRGVTLDVEGLREGTCVHLALDPTSTDGEALWSAEAWYTLNRLPRGRTARIGMGAEPPLRGARLWNAGSGPTLVVDSAPRPVNLTSDEIRAGGTPLILEPGGPEARSTTRFGQVQVHVEWRAVTPGAEPASLWLELGDVEVELPTTGDASGGWWAFDVLCSEAATTAGSTLWSAGSCVLSTGPDDVEEPWELRLRAEGGEGASALEVRNVWVAPSPLAPDRRERSPRRWRSILKDADDWEPRGGQAVYTLEDGVLTGVTRPNTPNTFFTSRDTYDNFELVFDVKVHPELNSGVQIRSQVIGGFENRSGNLKGYQAEIDPSERSWSAGIYDEAGRAWLHPLHAAPYARRAWRQGEWNHYRIVCDGPWIRTWINGVPAADLLDYVGTEGHIGFQVHGVGGREDPLEVQWRNVRLRKLR